MQVKRGLWWCLTEVPAPGELYPADESMSEERNRLSITSGFLYLAKTKLSKFVIQFSQS